jgi:hypothetical protein
MCLCQKRRCHHIFTFSDPHFFPLKSFSCVSIWIPYPCIPISTLQPLTRRLQHCCTPQPACSPQNKRSVKGSEELLDSKPYRHINTLPCCGSELRVIPCVAQHLASLLGPPQFHHLPFKVVRTSFLPSERTDRFRSALFDFAPTRQEK